MANEQDGEARDAAYVAQAVIVTRSIDLTADQLRVMLAAQGVDVPAEGVVPKVKYETQKDGTRIYRVTLSWPEAHA